MGQAAMAAMLTAPEDRVIHSLHGYFLRPGDIHSAIDFTVDTIHDGKSFSTRRTQAFQNGTPIFSMIASFQVPDDGLEHAQTAPPDLPDPDSLPSDSELVGVIENPVARQWVANRPFDVRHVDGDIFDSPRPAATTQQTVWLRAKRPLPEDSKIHLAALAYLSDLTVLEPVLRAHTLHWGYPGLRVASLDHALWIHRPARVDEWLAYVQTSPSAQGGRGLACGQLFDRAGMLVATIAQEGMVRVPSRE